MNVGDEFEGRYRIIGELGRGGYATVWLAEHTRIGQKVAIKMTHEPGSDPRFLREARVMATLKSPHTVRIMDFGETAEGHAYIISEFIEGQSLDEIRKQGPLPGWEVTQILEQVLKSLAEAHEQGIIHRDVKPANIMRTPDGTIKVLDFGIARVTEQVDVGDLTASGIVLGTPRYLAPECLLRPETVQPSADIFALGLVAYALLAGQDANEGLSGRQIVARTLSNEPFVLPEALLVPSALSRWVATATAKHPEARFPNAMVALGALHEGAADLESTQNDFAVKEAIRTFDGTPHVIARPAAEPTMHEEGALAFGNDIGSVTGFNEEQERANRRATKARDVPHEAGVDIDHAVMNEISGERQRAAARSREIARQVPSEPKIELARPPAREREPYQGPRIYEERRRSWGWLWIVVILGAAVFAAWHFRLIPRPPERPNLGPVADDPAHVIETYAQGKLAFRDGRWEEALMHFNNLEQWPDTNSARDMSANDYVGRIIGDVLQDAVDIREKAKSVDDLERAAEGPKKILEYYPQHEASRYVLSTIEEERDVLTKKKKRRKRDKMDEEHPVWRSNRPPIDITFDE